MHELRCESVVAGYGRRAVLKELSFSLKSGEVVALIGPNGCGKSTLVRVLSGMLKAMSGEVSFDGESVNSLSPKSLAQRVAVVPQHEDTIFDFDVREVVAMGRYAWNDEGVHHVDEGLRTARSEELASRRLSELSGGERQRVLLARSIAQDSPVMLLDEPTSHMDVGYQIATLGLLRSLARGGKAICAVLHDLNLAAGFADRAVLMHDGRVEAQGMVEDVLQSPEIDRVYGAAFSRTRDAFTGRLILAPEFVPEKRRTTRPRRLHVVGGGGSASAFLTELWQLGHELSVGVTHELDSDTEAANRLQIQAITAAPFSTITQADVEKMWKIACSADAVVVCPAPYGPGNLANLELIRQLGEAGKPIIWIDWPEKPWDFARGQASEIVNDIRAKFGVLWIPGAELSDAIEDLS